jgi:hypothetical protein
MTKRIISIDVGIKNLALCILESNSKTKIINWDVLDISPTVVERKKVDEKCPTCKKRRATYGYMDKEEVQLSCKVCLRKRKGNQLRIFLDDMLRETQEHHSIRVVDFVNIERMTKAKIGDFFNCLSLVSNGSLATDIPKKMKKVDMVKIVRETLIKYAIIPVKHVRNVFSEKSVRVRKTGYTDFVKIAKKIPSVLDRFIEHDTCQYSYTVVIENQITKVANKMKSIQLMLTQYFIMRGIEDVRFVSAKHKLNQFGGENSKQMPKKERMSKVEYNKRKNAGIEYTRNILNVENDVLLNTLKVDKSESKWLRMFESHRKKDDLADAFLQGIWFIRHSLKV